VAIALFVLSVVSLDTSQARIVPTDQVSRSCCSSKRGPTYA
jgi:hypothetical protein